MSWEILAEGVFWLFVLIVLPIWPAVFSGIIGIMTARRRRRQPTARGFRWRTVFSVALVVLAYGAGVVVWETRSAYEDSWFLALLAGLLILVMTAVAFVGGMAMLWLGDRGHWSVRRNAAGTAVVLALSVGAYVLLGKVVVPQLGYFVSVVRSR